MDAARYEAMISKTRRYSTNRISIVIIQIRICGVWERHVMTERIFRITGLGNRPRTLVATKLKGLGQGEASFANDCITVLMLTHDTTRTVESSELTEKLFSSTSGSLTLRQWPIIFLENNCISFRVFHGWYFVATSNGKRRCSWYDLIFANSIWTASEDWICNFIWTNRRARPITC